MARKWIVVAAVIALSVGIAGCGGGDGDGNGAAEPTAPEGETLRGDPITGRDAFILGTTPPCGDCHTLADAGTTGTIGPSLDEAQPTFDEVITALDTGPGAMPSFADISPDVKENIAAYVSTAAGQG